MYATKSATYRLCSYITPTLRFSSSEKPIALSIRKKYVKSEHFIWQLQNKLVTLHPN